MIDNFKLLSEHMDFSEPNTKYYMLEVIKRKKDNPGFAQNQRKLKEFIIETKDYLFEHETTIKKLCDDNNARAYLRMNRRSYQETAYNVIKYQGDLLAKGDYKGFKKAWSKSSGRKHCEKKKIWIIDIDEKNLDFVYEIINEIKTIQENMVNNEEYKVLTIIPTLNGYHILTNPFDLSKFNKENIDIHKDNPTILYVP